MPIYYWRTQENRVASITSILLVEEKKKSSNCYAQKIVELTSSASMPIFFECKENYTNDIKSLIASIDIDLKQISY